MSDTEHTPPKKKIRIRNCIFNENWRLDANYKNWLVRAEKKVAVCAKGHLQFSMMVLKQWNNTIKEKRNASD